jgi:hypothetical protein
MTQTKSRFVKVVAAMGQRHTHQWNLADALLAEVPQNAGHDLFEALRGEVAAAGHKPLSRSAMRQYRDAAHSWPVAKRVDGVSFTCHRVALASKDPESLLRALAATHGADAVTVAMVRDAIALEQGVPLPSAVKAAAKVAVAQVPVPAPTKGVALTWGDIVTALIEGVSGDLNTTVLGLTERDTTRLVTGVTKVADLAAVQAATFAPKAPRQVRKVAAKPAAKAPAKGTTPKAPAKAKADTTKAPDLRDL